MHAITKRLSVSKIDFNYVTFPDKSLNQLFYAYRMLVEKNFIGMIYFLSIIYERERIHLLMAKSLSFSLN